MSIDPVKFPLTGIGRYTYELASGLQRQELAGLRFLRGSRLCAALPAHEAVSPFAGAASWQKHLRQSRAAVALYRAVSSRLKSRALKGLEDHVFHGPNYYLPPFAGRSVVTMHDLSPYLWPESHPPERVRYMRAEIELALRRAALLITDTEYTRQEVAQFFSWPLDRIHAVHLAAAPEFMPQPAAALAPLLHGLGLTADGYALTAATIEPRKNLVTLLDAYARLPEALRQRWPLVVVGYRGWRSEALHARLEAAERAGWLRYLGFVPHAVLPPLMAGARLFAYPSLYEGFGLPVLEAMASGVPVICSNASTLPEVAGTAAALHAPTDADALLALLRRGLEDAAWRQEARAAGLQQAAGFSWQRCTEETLRVYRAATHV